MESFKASNNEDEPSPESNNEDEPAPESNSLSQHQDRSSGHPDLLGIFKPDSTSGDVQSTDLLHNAFDQSVVTPNIDLFDDVQVLAPTDEGTNFNLYGFNDVDFVAAPHQYVTLPLVAPDNVEYMDLPFVYQPPPNYFQSVTLASAEYVGLPLDQSVGLPVDHPSPSDTPSLKIKRKPIKPKNKSYDKETGKKDKTCKKDKTGKKEKTSKKEKKKKDDEDEEEPAGKRGPKKHTGGRPTYEQQIAKLELQVEQMKMNKPNTPLQEVNLPIKVEADDVALMNVEEEDVTMEKAEDGAECPEDNGFMDVETILKKENSHNGLEEEKEDEIKAEDRQEEKENDDNGLEEEDETKKKAEDRQEEKDDDDNDEEDERIFKNDDPETMQILIICEEFTKANKQEMEVFFGLRFPIDRIGKSAYKKLFIVKTVVKEYGEYAIKKLNETAFGQSPIRAHIYSNRGVFKLPHITIFTDKKNMK